MMLLVHENSEDLRHSMGSLSFADLITMPDDELEPGTPHISTPLGRRSAPPLELQYPLSPGRSEQDNQPRPSSAPLSFYAVQKIEHEAASDPQGLTSGGGLAQRSLDLQHELSVSDALWDSSDDASAYYSTAHLTSPLSQSYLSSLLEAPAEPGTLAASGLVDERKIFGWAAPDGKPYLILDPAAEAERFRTQVQAEGEGNAVFDHSSGEIDVMPSQTQTANNPADNLPHSPHAANSEIATAVLAVSDTRPTPTQHPVVPAALRSPETGEPPFHITPMWEEHLRARLMQQLAHTRVPRESAPPLTSPPLPTTAFRASSPAPPACQRRSALSTSAAADEDPRADRTSERAPKRRKHPPAPQGGVRPELARKMARARVAKERETAETMASNPLARWKGTPTPADGEAAVSPGAMGSWANAEFGFGGDASGRACAEEMWE